MTTPDETAPTTVCLLSGGMDSATLLYSLLSAGHKVRALAVDYDQRHRCELSAAQLIAQAADVPLTVADLSGIRRLLGGSSQTDHRIEVPEGHYADETMRLTVVPNRNMILIAIAAGHAISIKADAIAYAAHAGDHAIYPDCRPDFIKAMELPLSLCDYKPLRLLAPFRDKDKAWIAGRGHDLGVPFGLTWTCYKGGLYHCGKCGSCTERKEAFEKAGVPDPTQYQ